MLELAKSNSPRDDTLQDISSYSYIIDQVKSKMQKFVDRLTNYKSEEELGSNLIVELRNAKPVGHVKFGFEVESLSD